ncbi:conserved hypothetical protein [Ricinus communis]|uniref:Uncharacterized protein n=1 Tax=Ricinus communis TaxID=3988 RepID=B9TJU9_RICCO|nr:conserved hypothetical protein [Ricinus communis]
MAGMRRFRHDRAARCREKVSIAVQMTSVVLVCTLVAGGKQYAGCPCVEAFAEKMGLRGLLWRHCDRIVTPLDRIVPFLFPALSSRKELLRLCDPVIFLRARLYVRSRSGG